MTRHAVFLDRDGVLNEVVERDGKPASPRSLDEFRLVGGASAAVARLQRAGLAVLVVTNQPDISRGLLLQRELDSMEELLRTEAGVDDVAICPHDDADACSCRKPLPGLLQQLAATWEVDLARSYMVGDTWRDMAAGRAAGCRTILLRTVYNEGVESDAGASDISGASDWILREEERARTVVVGETAQ